MRDAVTGRLLLSCAIFCFAYTGKNMKPRRGQPFDARFANAGGGTSDDDGLAVGGLTE